MSKRILSGALVALCLVSEAAAQSSVLPYFYNASNQKTPVGTNSPLPITGSISASLAPFTPGLSGARGTPLSVTTSDSSGNLPTNTGSVIVTNVGANPMYCNVNAIAATTSDQYISASGGWFNFGIPSGITTLRCIATGSTTTANTVGGSGLGAGTGGGSGGGGGGAVTLASGAVASGAYSSGSIASGAFASGSIGSGAVASGAVASGAFASGSIGSGAMAAGSHAAGSGVDGWDLTQGAIADASVTAGATGSISAKLRRISADIDSVKTNTAAAIPAQATNAVNIGAVMNAGSTYETVAASQTGQILGGAGAIGDYLSHCVLYPVTTSPGVVTVFDDATSAAANVITFAGGASSLSNLAPIPIPVGAVSTAGEWRVTTGTNIIVTCYGKFT